MSNRTRIVGIAALVVFTGCADSKRPSTELARDYVAALCDAYFDCAQTDPTNVQWITRVRSRAGCERELTILFDDPVLDAALEDGTASINRSALRECTRRIRIFCDEAPWPCNQIYVGTIPPGGACRTSAECQNDGICTGLLDAACGMCVSNGTSVPLGQTCLQTEECLPSPEGEVTCRPNPSGPSTCELAPPPRLAQIGDACGEGTGPGGEDVVCTPGLYCGFDGPNRACVEPLRLDDDCTPGTDACQRGLVCAAEGQGSPRCRALVVQTRVDAPCDPSASSFVVCSEYEALVCDPATNTCRRLGDGGLDQGCLVDTNCGAGLYCNRAFGASEGTCASKKALGTPCIRYGECASSFCGLEGDAYVCQNARTLPICE